MENVAMCFSGTDVKTEPRKVFETPYVTSSEVDFGLASDTMNRRRLDVIIHSQPLPLVVMETPKGILYHATGIAGGKFCFVSTATKLIEYFMQYEESAVPGFGKCATQVKIWNRLAPEGMTGKVFFGEMLNRRFDTMISDRVQTKSGARFWLIQLHRAVEKACRIGLMDGATVVPYDPGTDLTGWIGSVDGWGEASVHHERRFFISTIAA